MFGLNLKFSRNSEFCQYFDIDSIIEHCDIDSIIELPSSARAKAKLRCTMYYNVVSDSAEDP